ncbi:tail fiber domain-containing protein [Citrobacter sp. RHBSTW-00678]|uniref:tail fiber domain-containing protein n=1 Tax=unclassified Citrobacter TaxID=2644389 RepID=UPI0015E9777C|nr:tail fiber domain-containing protein [Citrobacter sp. RHBSTW-00325]MBA7760021.1 tail fiber domain-containing protein [Citrobacter sp. RHBSTW-00325]QLV88289.1 tail fiber domain-containing protein [Citrobacter sp. RHBSTW-00678]
MSAGTLTLTNNSALVSGTGTTFSTELSAGDFIVVTVGGVPYTLPVKSVESGTALTLVSNFTGPTQSGAAWSAVPRVALNMVTAALVTQSAEALRGLNYDKQNWQQVFSNSGNITVKLPDGTTFTGPSWLFLSQSLAGKVNSDDSRLGTVNGKSGGVVLGTVKAGSTSPASTPPVGAITNSELIGSRFRSGVYSGIDFSMYAQVAQGQGSYGYLQLSYGGSPAYWSFGQDGIARGAGWSPTCDERLKDLNGPIDDPLGKMRQVRGQTWIWKSNGSFGIGFTAQDVQKIFPKAVVSGQDIELDDGSIVEGVLSPDTYGVSAALHHEAILALMDKIVKLEETVKKLWAGD